MLFLTWSELDIVSGTPMVVRDLLDYFPSSDAEVMVELNVDTKQHRQVVDVKHKVSKFSLHAKLWPFKRGSRVRNLLARISTPALTLQMVMRIRRLKPDCIFAIYFQPHWIFAAWMASRVTGVPLVYHVHDAFLESFEHRKNSRFLRWLERKTLTGARVLALDDNMAQHYEQRYAIQCTMLRHIVRHAPYPAAAAAATPSPSFEAAKTPTVWSGAPRRAKELTIGFSGAVYDSNSRQLAELCRLVGEDPSLRLRIRTGYTVSQLEALGICGPRVEIGFAPSYEQMLLDLTQCDLLYLPLHFEKGPMAAEGAMEFSLPTKIFDFLLSGVPILAHCPPHFSLSRFFRKYPCAHILNEPGPEAVRRWLAAWRGGEIPPLSDTVRLSTLQMYTPKENKRVLWKVLAEETDRKIKRSRKG